VRFDPEQCNSQEGELCFDHQEGKSHARDGHTAPEGHNSRHHPRCFAREALRR